MSRSQTSVPGVDTGLLAKDAAKLLPAPTRRQFVRASASLGALAFLAGCDIIDGPSAENALRIVSRFNDRVQAWLFNPNRLAPTYPESAITRPFPFNAYYREEEAPDIDEDNYKLLIDGLVDDKNAVDARSSLRAAPGDPDHSPRLRRGLERDRKMDWNAAP